MTQGWKQHVGNSNFINAWLHQHVPLLVPFPIRHIDVEPGLSAIPSQADKMFPPFLSVLASWKPEDLRSLQNLECFHFIIID